MERSGRPGWRDGHGLRNLASGESRWRGHGANGEDAWASISAEDLLRTYFTDIDEPDQGEVSAPTASWQPALPRQQRLVRNGLRRRRRVSMHTPVVGPEVGPATGVTTGPFNEGGVIQVNWDAAPNAAGYIIYAVNVDELNDANGQIVVAAVNDAAAETYNLDALNVWRHLRHLRRRDG